MAKPKAVPMSVPKSRETVESDSDDLDQLGSEDESSEESSSSGEEEDEDRGAPVRSASNGHAKKKNGKYPSYEPPPGMSALPVNVTTAASAFEWNELANKSGVELWCVRVPLNFKAARLQTLKLDGASLNTPTPTKPLGVLSTSKNTYHLVPSALASSSSSSSTDIPKHLNLEQEPDLRPSLVDSMLPADQVGRGARSAGDHDRDKARENVVRAELGLDGGKVAGAEEMQGLKLVVPDGRRAGFYLAPKQPTRHLILTPLVGHQPSAEPSTTLANPTTTENVTTSAPVNRHPQPAGLKYRNIPFGAKNPNTLHAIGGPGKNAGKEIMVAPSVVGKEMASGAGAGPETPSRKTKSKEKDGEKKKKRKSTGADGVEDPAEAEKREREKEKERKRKVEAATGGKSKRMKVE